VKPAIRTVLLLAALCAMAPVRAELSVPAGYEAAAGRLDFPPVLFYAMALTESGQSRMTPGYRAWPWTLSINREARYFPDRAAASAALRDALASGPEQLGVGLFQIEHRYHGHRFDSIDAMLDPYRNAQVAAEIFSEGLQETGGDLWAAVGRFHSSTPELAEAYRSRVAERLVRLLDRRADGH